MPWQRPGSPEDSILWSFQRAVAVSHVLDDPARAKVKVAAEAKERRAPLEDLREPKEKQEEEKLKGKDKVGHHRSAIVVENEVI